MLALERARQISRQLVQEETILAESGLQTILKDAFEDGYAISKNFFHMLFVMVLALVLDLFDITLFNTLAGPQWCAQSAVPLFPLPERRHTRSIGASLPPTVNKIATWKMIQLSKMIDEMRNSVCFRHCKLHVY